MLTLRQIEVIRAVMIAGTIAGAARMLGVSAPGISRLMKYTEASLKLKLFDRKQNRYFPTREAQDIFEQINSVYEKVDHLQDVLTRIDQGVGLGLNIASVPSLASMLVPRALRRLRERYPSLALDLEIIKVQEAQDYLLLRRGELAVLSYSFEHPGIDVIAVGTGELRCIVARDHPLAAKEVVTAAEIARYPLVGVPPEDPYGRITTAIFRAQNLAFKMAMTVRFGVTATGLVRAGLGISIIDQFAVGDAADAGLKVLRIAEPTLFEVYVARRADQPLSRYGAAMLDLLRQELVAATKA